MADHDACFIDSGAERPYLPAMGRRWLLPLYDPFTRLAGLPRIHRELVEQADLQAGLRVLEIGCGPGGPAAARPPQIPRRRSRRARPRPRRAGPRPPQARAGRAPRPGLRRRVALPGYQHRPSPVLLHVAPPRPHRGAPALQEIVRVLRPGGQLHLVDISATGAIHGLLARRAHRRAHQAHDVDSRPDDLLVQLRQAGLTDVTAAEQTKSHLGPHTFYRAVR